MAAVEALRMQIDSFQWEVNRLDAESLKLRSQSEEASTRVDLKAELEQSKQEVAGLTEQLRAYKRRTEELEQAAADAECQAARAQPGTESQTSPGALREHQRELEEALVRVTTAEERVQRLETKFSRSRVEDELREKEQEIELLRSELATLRWQLCREAEVDRY